MEHYCAYLRKSRADRDAELRGEGETLARHKRILEDLSERMRKPIERFYSEIVSGDSIVARPAVQELLQDVENGMWDGVFVVEVERLARGDSIDQGIVSRTFQLTDTKIITPAKTYDPSNEYDNEYFEFSLFMSRREYKTIKRRMQAGREASVKEGNYIGSLPPFGYRKVRLEAPQKGYALETVPDEAETVKMIFTWFCYGIDGEGPAGRNIIANKLNEMRRFTKKGTKWTYSAIDGVLKNPVHAGYVWWNHRPECKEVRSGSVSTKRRTTEDYILVKGKHPAIISDDLFELAQDIRKKRYRPATHARLSTITNPLAGLVVCGVCGHHMQYRLRGTRSPRDTILCTYHCGCRASYFDLVEEAVLDGMKDIMERYKIDLSVPEQNKVSDIVPKQISRLEADISAEQSKLNQIFDFLESGIYSVDVFRQRKEVIDGRIQELNDSIEKLRNQYESQNKRTAAMRAYVPKAESFLSSYGAMTAAEKNTMFRELIDHIVYTKTERGQINKVVPFKLDIYPKLPV